MIDKVTNDLTTIPRAIGLPGTFTRTSWTPPDKLTFAEWLAAGRRIIDIGIAAQWWIGDWWNSQPAYGERVALARECLPLELDTIRNYASTAANVYHFRSDTLTFAHHRQVAPIADPEVQRQWLERAASEGWSVRQLHDAIEQSQLASQTQDNDDGDATEEDEASDLGAPIDTGGGDDNQREDTTEHPIEEPKPIAPPPGPTPEQYDRHLLMTFNGFAGGLYPLISEPLQLFAGTGLSPTRLRTVAAFLERAADAIEGRLQDEGSTRHTAH
ncbi:MAG: hypothetical protein ACLP19_28445 [Xanthobacteraceae bacterium]